MAKQNAFTPKPRVEKLPLAVRKEIRDKYEAKKEEFESQISELLGTKFVINFDPPQVWAYAVDSTSTAGYVFSGYAEGFIYGLQNFIEYYKDEGLQYFNKAVSQSELTLAVNPLGDEAETITADIQDGVFRILFKHDCLGYNTSQLERTYFAKAIDNVDIGETYSLKAKYSIVNKWDENVEEVTKEIGEILNLPDVIIDPNFEEVYAELKAAKKDSDWEQSFGAAIFAYFDDGLKYQLVRAGFKDDDMLQEGFAEVVTSKTIKLRIVKAYTQGGYRNETEIVDGILYLQVKADEWYYNTSDMGDNLLKLL